jgi:hypothetical protein
MRTAMLIAAAATAVLGLAAPANAQGKQTGCVLAGGEATMVTGDLARFMANAALKNSISGKGLKPSGQIKMTCKDGLASVHCLAQQRACK